MASNDITQLSNLVKTDQLVLKGDNETQHGYYGGPISLLPFLKKKNRLM
jgi:hypothetical protein